MVTRASLTWLVWNLLGVPLVGLATPGLQPRLIDWWAGLGFTIMALIPIIVNATIKAVIEAID